MLGLLAGLAAGLVIAAVDGAQRSGSAYQRMRDHLAAADAVFFPSQVLIGDADVTKLGSLPEVAAWAGFALNESHFDGLPPDASPLIPVGKDWFTTIERAKVLAGRLPNPARDDEMVVTEPVVHAGLGVRLGSVYTWRNLSLAQAASYPNGTPPDFDWSTANGPMTKMKVVGVVRLPMESVLSFASGGLLLPGPGWADAHLKDVSVFFTNALVRLQHGAADLATFQSDVAREYGRSDIPVKDLSNDIKRVQGSVDLERTALLLFASVVLIAALVLVGQAVVRSVRAGLESAPTLSAMGLPDRAIVGGAVAQHTFTAAIASTVAVLSSVVLSARFPIGLSRQLDPALGMHVRLLTVAAAVATGLVVLAGVLLAAWVSLRAAQHRLPVPHSRVLGSATRAGLPVPSAVGASLALDRAAAHNAPVRPALVAAVVGVVGIVGAMTLVGGIDDALHHPRVVGTVWDLEITPSGDQSDAAVIARLKSDRNVADIALVDRFAAQVGQADVPVYTIQPLQGALQFTVYRGRAPVGNAEVALGPRSAAVLHVRIGESVSFGGQSFAVVGLALMAQTPHSSFDEGGWVTPAGFNRAGATPDLKEEIGVVRLAKGVDRQTALAELADVGASLPAAVPDVANLSNVRRLPLYLAGFLVLLGLGAVAHTLASGARRRTRDVAVLRALGLTPRQAGACVAWQATVIGVVAVAIGLPIGVLVGRQVWRLVTDSLSFVYRGPFASGPLLIAVPAVLISMALLAIWPARLTARLRTAEVLRRE